MDAAKPCPENGQFHVRNPGNNLVREPLKEPVKEEEGAQAREEVSEEFFGKLLGALGFAENDTLPAWWQGWPPREHVRRWRDDLGLSEVHILEVAADSRRTHHRIGMSHILVRIPQGSLLAGAAYRKLLATPTCRGT